MEKTKVNWTSVKDGLPRERRSAVVICYKTAMGRNILRGTWEHKKFLVYDSEYGDIDYTNCVTHWIPDLELPKE